MTKPELPEWQKQILIVVRTLLILAIGWLANYIYLNTREQQTQNDQIVQLRQEVDNLRKEVNVLNVQHQVMIRQLSDLKQVHEEKGAH